MSEGSPGTLAIGELRPILEHVHATLAAHREEVDALNVFPVPDGDTGTNMTATARAALEALEEVGDAVGEEQAQAVARGALRGARGNSGVILSQILRAFVAALARAGELDPEGLAGALERARDLAYDAVADPVEGTILTTISRAAMRARRCVQEERELAATLAAVLEEVEAATEDTGQMLRANRDAGVVDAGARGFALVIGALHAHVTGGPVPRPGGDEPRPPRARSSVVATRETGSLAYHFEVQYLLDAGEGVVAVLRDELRSIGDSVVVAASGELVSVHVHTNEVGKAIELGLHHGRPSDISVVYFADDVAAGHGEPGERPEQAPLGCVAVLPSGPLQDLARDHGVVPVTGTSGQLPSVDDLIDGIRRAHATRVVLLPGHRNAVPTARQARELADEEELAIVEVLEAATSVPAVVAALAVFQPEAEVDSVLADLEEAVAAVRPGEVVAAVRDADTPIGRVAEGQHLTIAGNEVIAAESDPIEALRILSRHLAEDGPCELVTLIVGADVDEPERERAATTVREALGDVELEVVEGLQRPARYLIGVE